MPEPMFFPDAGRPQRAGAHRELAISELFARQRTLGTLDQLAELGLGRRAVRHRAEIGRLHRVYPAVYSTTPVSLLPPKARWLAAVLACAPDAYLSHRSAGGDVIRADFLWRELRVVVETDGDKGHKTPWARERDARRDLLLIEAGWRPVRLTWRMVFQTPAETTRTFGNVLAQAGALRVKESGAWLTRS